MPPQNQNPIEQNNPSPTPPQFGSGNGEEKDKKISRIGKKSFIISLLLFIPSIPMALMSPLIFDAPGSEQCTYTVVTFWCSILYPVAFIIFALLYRKFTKLGKHALALLFSLIPLLFFIIGLVAMIINKGKFTC